MLKLTTSVGAVFVVLMGLMTSRAEAQVPQGSIVVTLLSERNGQIADAGFHGKYLSLGPATNLTASYACYYEPSFESSVPYYRETRGNPIGYFGTTDVHRLKANESRSYEPGKKGTPTISKRLIDLGLFFQQKIRAGSDLLDIPLEITLTERSLAVGAIFIFPCAGTNRHRLASADFTLRAILNSPNRELIDELKDPVTGSTMKASIKFIQQ